MKNNKGILQALLPGARIDKNTNKIFVHTGTSNDVIKINVGGSIFETYRSTLSAVPSSRLSDESFLGKLYRADQNDYFFDRDPEIFHCVLNYFRSGELHLPTSVCGLVVKSELEFWGIRDDNIEECCWSRYSGWTSTLHALRKLEDDQTSLVTYWEYPPEDSPPWLKKNQTKDLVLLFSAIFIESSAVKTMPHPALVYIDIACLAFFCLELITRVLTSPHPFKFLVMPMTVIELLAVLTDFIDHVIRMTYLSTGSDEILVSVVSFMKLLRVFRVFRLMRHIPRTVDSHVYIESQY
ncbi:hypothetical protein Btru_005490 [Bulinus truncatus]|nr:hypothetical protein Btru_005490 [Bulinus truncatus]